MSLRLLSRLLRRLHRAGAVCRGRWSRWSLPTGCATAPARRWWASPAYTGDLAIVIGIVAVGLTLRLMATIGYWFRLGRFASAALLM